MTAWERRGLAGCTGGVLALFLLLLELMKTLRSSQWAVLEGGDWLGLALGLTVYALASAVLAGGIARLLARRMRGEDAAALGLAGAGAAIWAALSVFREHTPTLDDLLVLGLLTGMASAVALSRRVLRVSPAEVLGYAAFVLLIGLDALRDTALNALFAPDRAAQIVMAAAKMMAAAALLMGIALLLPRARVALRRGYFGLSLLLLCAAFAWNPGSPDAATPLPQDGRPNLVFIMSDTLRADYLARYGGPVPTPHLDALADRGADFTRAYALAPWTFPSMWGLLASQYPKGLSADGDDTWLEQIWRYVEDPGGVTLAEQLKAEGYRTAAMSANALLWGMPLATRGFDTLATAHPILLTREGPLRVLPFLHDALAALFPARVYPRPHNTTLDLAQYADAWLNENADAPFFLYMHYIDPHAPYDPPARYRNLQGPWPFFHPYAGGERWGIPQLVGDFVVAEADRGYVRDLYQGEIRYVDEFIGRLLASLDRLGLRENTIIAFTSDHGEELWDHGEWGHGQSLHEELLRVPLIYAGPGIAAQQRHERVSAIDFTPTTAALMGLPQDAGWRGTSYAKALRRPKLPIPAMPIFAQGTSNKAWPHPQQAVIAGAYKLIRHAGSDTLELYDLETDPKEQHDLAAALPEQATALRDVLLSWLASFDSAFDNVPANGLSGEAVQQLEGMGYL